MLLLASTRPPHHAAALLLLDSQDHCVGCFTPPSAEDPFLILRLPLGFGTTIRDIYVRLQRARLFEDTASQSLQLI